MPAENELALYPTVVAVEIPFTTPMMPVPLSGVALPTMAAARMSLPKMPKAVALALALEVAEAVAVP